MNELFLISRGIWESASPKEVRATIEVLKQLEVYALPYPRVDIRVGVDYAVRWLRQDGEVVRSSALGPTAHVTFVNIEIVEGGITASNIFIEDTRTGFKEDILATHRGYYVKKGGEYINAGPEESIPGIADLLIAGQEPDNAFKSVIKQFKLER